MTQEPWARMPNKVAGKPTTIRLAEVKTVNDDGTIDVQPRSSRAGKHAVPVPSAYTPAVGDQVLIADLDGNPRTPICIGPF